MNPTALLLLAAALLLSAPAQAQLDIPFAPLEDTSLRDPDNPRKKFRVDLSKVERDFPLSRADLMKITPDALKRLSQEQIDQIYGRLTAGPIPNGPFSGDLFFARGDGDGDDDRRLRARLAEILGGVEGRLAGAEDQHRRAARPPAVEGQALRPRQARAVELHRRPGTACAR
jgi:hypothetical protein